MQLMEAGTRKLLHAHAWYFIAFQFAGFYRRAMRLL